jgi:beta-alanine--pyruvate transaminase
MQGPEGASNLFHGYTYSGHVLACAAALATLDTYEEEGIFQNAAERSARISRTRCTASKGCRTSSMCATSAWWRVWNWHRAPGPWATRAYDVFVACYNAGLLTRVTGDIIAISPPLIAERKHVDEMVGIIADVIKAVA